MSRVQSADIPPAWGAARHRIGVNRDAGVVYAEILRRGRIPRLERLAADCRLTHVRTEKALATLRAADLIPGKDTPA